MDKIISIAQVVIPILATVFLGLFARVKNIMEPKEIQGLQTFVLKFGLPCVLFNSCLTANVGAESLGVMALVLPCLLVASLWSYRARTKTFTYHNFPMLFSAQETGMLGIPLFMIPFGAAEAYRVGILDLTQALVAYPTIAILAAPKGDSPSPLQVVKNVVTSPLLLISLLGLALNLTGIGNWLNQIGIGGIITASTSFMAQPVSALMIFSVGYNFSLSGGNRSTIFRITLIHILMFAIFGGLIQLALFLIPGVDALTRWSILMYSTLPASYLAPGLGRTEEDISVASGVCSLTTLASLAIFCVMAVFAA